MNIANRLATFFNIRSDEIPLVSAMLLQAALFGIPGIVTETAAYSLFLERYDAVTIPFVFVGFAVTSVVIGLLFTWLEEHVDFTPLMVLYPALLFVALLLFRLLLHFVDARWPIFAFAIWSDTTWVLINLAYWNLAGRLFNVRQSKRLFGLLGAMVVFAEIASGLLTPLFVRVGGTANLLLVAAAATGVATLYQFRILRRFAPQDEEEDEEEEAIGGVRGLWELTKHGYVRLIILFSSLSMMAYYFVDNALYDQADSRFGSADETAVFIGLFFAVSGIITIFVSTFASSRLFKRFGIRGGLFVQPIVLIIGTSIIILTGFGQSGVGLFFWLIVGTKMINQVMKDSLETMTARILYQPLPANLQLRVQTAVESIIEPVAAGFAGLVLIVHNSVLAHSSDHIINFVFWMAVIVLLAGWQMARIYPQMIRQAWETRRLSGDRLLAEDNTGAEILEGYLSSSQPGAVIYALDLLEKMDQTILNARLPMLLAHRAVEVRLDVLQRIERLELTAVLPLLQSRLSQEGAYSVRGAILRTLAVLGDEKQHEFVYPYLDDPNPAVAEGAILGLLRSGDLGAMMGGVEKLQQWLLADEPETRIRVADVLGESGLQTVYRPLLKLLADQDLTVRRAGLKAAGKLNNPKLWAIFLRQLEQLRGRELRVKALAAGGDQVLPLLETLWDEPGQAVSLRLSLVKIVTRIGTENGTQFLTARLDTSDFLVQTAVLQSLRQRHYQTPYRQPIEQAIEAEVAQMTYLLAVQQDVVAAPQMLADALATQIEQHRARLFCWLSFLYEPLMLTQIEERLATPEADEEFAFALELIDETLPTKLSQLLLPMLDDLPAEQRLGRLKPYFPQQSASFEERLRELTGILPAWQTAWLLACTIYTAGDLTLWGLTPEISIHRDSSDQLVRETAVSVHAKLAKGKTLMEQTLIEKIICLKSVPFFTDVPEATLAEVAVALEPISASAGAAILSGDTVESSLYIVVAGEAQLANGEIFRPNDTFGELMLLDPVAQPLEITAVSDTHLLKLDRDLFQEITQTHPEVAWKVMELLAQRLRWTQAHSTSIGRRQQREAVLDRLAGI
ncbi:MAG: MFS transporter [Chloroflexota bacterium]